LIYLDTHVVAWLYGGESARLTPTARRALEREPLLISPMVELELAFLKDVGRIKIDPRVIVEHLGSRIGLAICDLPFPKVISNARALSWTRDPFDRVIVGHALAADRPLVTKDRSIRRRMPSAIW
jgi:PIN domain nuclease of toxin-antitoxin system